jgi:hypothetical protein
MRRDLLNEEGVSGFFLVRLRKVEEGATEGATTQETMLREELEASQLEEPP